MFVFHRVCIFLNSPAQHRGGKPQTHAKCSWPTLNAYVIRIAPHRHTHLLLLPPHQRFEFILKLRDRTSAISQASSRHFSEKISTAFEAGECALLKCLWGAKAQHRIEVHAFWQSVHGKCVSGEWLSNNLISIPLTEVARPYMQRNTTGTINIVKTVNQDTTKRRKKYLTLCSLFDSSNQYPV